MKLLLKILNLKSLLKKKCKLHKKCDLYNKNSLTCNRFKNSNYCGKSKNIESSIYQTKNAREFINKLNEKLEILYIDTSGNIILKQHDYSMEKECCTNCKHYWCGYDDNGNLIGFCNEQNRNVNVDDSHKLICIKFKLWYLL